MSPAAFAVDATLARSGLCYRFPPARRLPGGLTCRRRSCSWSRSSWCGSRPAASGTCGRGSPPCAGCRTGCGSSASGRRSAGSGRRRSRWSSRRPKPPFEEATLVIFLEPRDVPWLWGVLAEPGTPGHAHRPRRGSAARRTPISRRSTAASWSPGATPAPHGGQSAGPSASRRGAGAAAGLLQVGGLAAARRRPPRARPRRRA